MSVLSLGFRELLRTLIRERSYSLTVILTLALTIGATTAVFSIVDGVLLRPLPYPRPDRLVQMNEVWQQFIDRVPTLPVNERHFEYWREHAQSFESLAQYLPVPANLTGAGQAEQISVVRASGTLFEVLGARAAIGRTLSKDDEAEGRPAVAVITDRLWRQRLDADPAIVGSPLTIDGRPYTVVGVLAADFRLPVGAQLTTRLDAFIPLRVAAGWVGEHNNLAIGRLGEGASIERARAELNLVQRQISEIATAQAHEPVTLSATVTPLAESVVGGARRGLWMLLAAVAAVLLIACSNLANLSLARAVDGLRDGAIRTALGAGRHRLIARAVAEQVVLAVAGGGAGLCVAWAALAGFVRAAPIDLPRAAEVALDRRVAVFAAILSILTGLTVSILPALRAASADLQGMLRSGGNTVAGDRGGMRTRSVLLAVQVGVSVTLLVVTGLLTTSLVRVLRVDTGFSADRVLAVDIALPAAAYPGEDERIGVYERLLTAVEAVPGVDSASTISLLPFGGGGQVNFIVPEGKVVPRSEQASANFRFVAPGYFRTVGIALRRGRTFAATERGPGRLTPSVISGAAAARLWPGEDAIGRRFSRGIEGEAGFEVVGITADARTTSIESDAPLMVYVPYWWRTRTATSLVVKTATDPEAAIGSIRRAIAAVDPEIAVGQTRTLAQLVDRAVASRRFQAALFVSFGFVALFIAAIGVYAVTAYGVSRRRRELNIRAALGAQASQVWRMIVRQGSVPIAAGVAAGMAAALALGSTVSALLYDVDAGDPRILSGVALLVSAVGVAAAAIAARRGASIDPAAALRDQ